MSDPSVYRCRPEFVTVQGRTIAAALRALAALLEEEGIASDEEIRTLEVQSYPDSGAEFAVSFVHPSKTWHRNSDGHYVERE